ncbi:protein PLANT CADMIUM RESISTANCE 8 [Vitis vinifera]|uniref:protein PLANT CADMIUM RESISTANCE 8 n=1 Tax=Vitis vinifera TaxID=29760 RepID=UPI00053F6541|nr:protein PLANT CADMIUM RESISTANCE 8 [Vitis vinifera]|eukprot:XP_010648511.1 PREDICTED: protein PLANT CADMIUM RESISTANCE 8-like [Vitis vinifera]
MQVVEPPRPNDQLVMYAAPLPEANKMEGSAGGGGANALVPVTRQESGQIHLILIQAVGNPWSSGLFDCYQHPINAMITTVAPYVTFGQIAEIVDNGSTSYVTGATLYFYLFFAINHWNIGVRYRRRVRDAYQLAEMPLTDRLVRLVCLVSGVQRA